MEIAYRIEIKILDDKLFCRLRHSEASAISLFFVHDLKHRKIVTVLARAQIVKSYVPVYRRLFALTSFAQTPQYQSAQLVNPSLLRIARRGSCHHVVSHGSFELLPINWSFGVRLQRTFFTEPSRFSWLADFF